VREKCGAWRPGRGSTWLQPGNPSLFGAVQLPYQSFQKPPSCRHSKRTPFCAALHHLCHWEGSQGYGTCAHDRHSRSANDSAHSAALCGASLWPLEVTPTWHGTPVHREARSTNCGLSARPADNGNLYESRRASPIFGASEEPQATRYAFAQSVAYTGTALEL